MWLLHWSNITWIGNLILIIKSVTPVEINVSKFPREINNENDCWQWQRIFNEPGMMDGKIALAVIYNPLEVKM